MGIDNITVIILDFTPVILICCEHNGIIIFQNGQ